jgi:hypothetical protein
MIAGKYLSRSRLFQRLKNGSDGQLIERYAARLVEDGRAQQGTLRCLRIIGGLLSWIAISRSRLTDLDARCSFVAILHSPRLRALVPRDRSAAP